MNAILNFLVEGNLCLIVMYAFYHVLLRTENQFDYKRMFLVSGMVASLLFPLITMPGGSTRFIPSLSNTTIAYWLPEITVYADSTAIALNKDPVISTWQWITYVYLAGAGLLLLLFIFRIISLIALFRISKKYTWRNFLVAESEHGSGSFSFFHFIFIGRVDQLDESEKNEILHHEAVHAEKAHSFDILLINLLGILFWFNPVVYLYRNSLIHIHEFEADARSVEGRDVDAYCSLLARTALHANGYPLANHFTNSLTLKRITMMKTVKQKINQWKIAASATGLLLIFFVVACQDQIMSELADSTVTQAEFPAVVKNDIATKYQDKYPGAKFNYMEGDADEIRQKFASNSSVNQILLNTYPLSDRNMIGVLTVDISNLELKNQNEVYSIVEETAKPKIGMEAFYQYIAANLQYPQEARTKGIEGKVFIEFVVNEDGTLSDIRPIKGIGAGCDEEAVRIIAQAERWEPGKQRGIAVKQRMVIPIIYRLDNAGQPAGKVEEAKQTMQVSGKLIQENGKSYMVGTVTNAEGKPLPGMNIVLAGTSTGTVSDTNGNYKLDVSNLEHGTLVFSFVGFKNESISF
jgi:TonB family protein